MFGRAFMMSGFDPSDPLTQTTVDFLTRLTAHLSPFDRNMPRDVKREAWRLELDAWAPFRQAVTRARVMGRLEDLATLKNLAQLQPECCTETSRCVQWCS